MTMTKKGAVKAQPEVQPQPEIVRHPNWPFHKVEAKNPYDTPPDQRFAFNCKSKVPPVIRQPLNDADMTWQGKPEN
jgi:hypothetical protein